MIDTHIHILPGLDDGPNTMEESLTMARMAVDAGVTAIVATPHTLNGVYDNPREVVLESCKTLSQALKNEGIGLDVLPGCEAHLSPELLHAVKAGEITTINDQGSHLLLELPHPVLMNGVIGVINHLATMGIQPVLAHVERLPAIQKNMEIVENLIYAGALCQITAGSLLGEYGSSAKQCSQMLLKEDLVHLVASDAHGIDWRPPNLGHVVSTLTSLVGEQEAHGLLHTNPARVISSELF